MAIGPNNEVMAVASEAARLESEFDKALSGNLGLIQKNDGISIHISTTVPPEKLFSKIGRELESRYTCAGWPNALLSIRDDSSLTLALYNN